MEKNPLRDFLNDPKYHVLRMAFVVACVHFTITYFLTAAEYPSFAHKVWQILTTPSYLLFLLSALVNYALWFLPFGEGFLIDWHSHVFSYTLVSSVCYGLVVGFLVSGRRALLIAAITLIFLCIFCLLAISLLAMIGQTNA
jgi:hypothetical protein